MAFCKIGFKVFGLYSSIEWKSITYPNLVSVYTLVLIFLSQFTLVLFSVYVYNATGSCKLSAIFVVTRLASLSVNLHVSSTFFLFTLILSYMFLSILAPLLVIVTR